MQAADLMPLSVWTVAIFMLSKNFSKQAVQNAIFCRIK